VKYTDNSTYSKTTDKGTVNYKTVDFFAWEKLDYVEAIKKAFNV
jgi:S-adenosylmethionine synthetase